MMSSRATQPGSDHQQLEINQSKELNKDFDKEWNERRPFGRGPTL